MDVEPVVYIGHPRDGILGYFDQFNLDPYKVTIKVATIC